MRNQYGAICWRMLRGRVQVLLITSRDTGRWVIPKGWPMEGLSPAQCAAQEAFEEAGVMGQVSDTCLGMFAYDKALVRGPGPEASSVPCMVAVYALQVSRMVDRYPEAGQRRRKWFTCPKAAERVAEPELQVLLAAFVPQPDAASPAAQA
nr:NUDIX hydrolase [Fertoeibacter niger]